MKRIGGTISVQVNGDIYLAKGDWTYNLGEPKHTVVKGVDGLAHGYVDEQQVAFIEGKFTDRGDLDTKLLTGLTNATVTLTLASGKVIVIRDAVYAAEGNGTTAESELDARFEGASGEEVPS